ncbi:MAG: prolyl oligopeptidase family serine peptidase [Verrucomicrobiales bacterium]
MAPLLAGMTVAAHGREWTSAEGASLQAEFISSDGIELTLKRDSDGKEFTIPISRLSSGDQSWVEEKIAESPAVPVERTPITGQYSKRITGGWVLSRYGALPYAIFGGAELDGSKRYPLLLALHDKSSNNTNGVQVPGWAKVFAEPENYAEHPCIIVVPLCYQPYGETDEGWSGGPPASAALRLVKDLVKDLMVVDADRVYIVGHAMGGIGANHMVGKEPELFAAAISVSGCAMEPWRAFRRLPYQLFHAADDSVVAVEGARKLAGKLGRHRTFEYTEIRTGGHNIGRQVFDDPKVRDWLFEQSR